MPTVHHLIIETNLFYRDSQSFQDMLDLTIGNFNLSTCLWVIWVGNLMGDEILLHQLLKNSIAEMLTSITNDCLRRTKMCKDSVSQKLDNNFVPPLLMIA